MDKVIGFIDRFFRVSDFLFKDRIVIALVVTIGC